MKFIELERRRGQESLSFNFDGNSGAYDLDWSFQALEESEKFPVSESETTVHPQQKTIMRMRRLNSTVPQSWRVAQPNECDFYHKKIGTLCIKLIGGGMITIFTREEKF